MPYDYTYDPLDLLREPEYYNSPSEFLQHAANRQGVEKPPTAAEKEKARREQYEINKAKVAEVKKRILIHGPSQPSFPTDDQINDVVRVLPAPVIARPPKVRTKPKVGMGKSRMVLDEDVVEIEAPQNAGTSKKTEASKNVVPPRKVEPPRDKPSTSFSKAVPSTFKTPSVPEVNLEEDDSDDDLIIHEARRLPDVQAQASPPKQIKKVLSKRGMERVSKKNSNESINNEEDSHESNQTSKTAERRTILKRKTKDSNGREQDEARRLDKYLATKKKTSGQNKEKEEKIMKRNRPTKTDLRLQKPVFENPSSDSDYDYGTASTIADPSMSSKQPSALSKKKKGRDLNEVPFTSSSSLPKKEKKVQQQIDADDLFDGPSESLASDHSKKKKNQPIDVDYFFEDPKTFSSSPIKFPKKKTSQRELPKSSSVPEKKKKKLDHSANVDKVSKKSVTLPDTSHLDYHLDELPGTRERTRPPITLSEHFLNAPRVIKKEREEEIEKPLDVDLERLSEAFFNENLVDQGRMNLYNKSCKWNLGKFDEKVKNDLIVGLKKAFERASDCEAKCLFMFEFPFHCLDSTILESRGAVMVKLDNDFRINHLAEHLTQINPRRMHRFNHVFLTLTHNIVISPQFIKTTQKPDYTKFVGSLSFDRLFKDSECLQDFQNSFVPIVENLLRITSAKKVVLIIPLVGKLSHMKEYITTLIANCVEKSRYLKDHLIVYNFNQFVIENDRKPNEQTLRDYFLTIIREYNRSL